MGNLTSIWSMPRFYKQAITLFVDTVFFIFAFFGALCARTGNTIHLYDEKNWQLLLPIVLISLLTFARIGLYRAFLRFLSLQTMFIIAFGAFFSALSLIFFAYFLQVDIPRTVPIIYFSFILICCGGIRFFIRTLYSFYLVRNSNAVLIYGAGASGCQLTTALSQSNEFKVAAFIDDNPKLHNKIIQGIKIHPPKNIKVLTAKYKTKKILLAMPSITNIRQQQIFEQIAPLGIELLSIPGFHDLVKGSAKIDELRKIEIEDLLGRNTIPPKSDLISTNIKNKAVLVTGAGGSIGSELCKEIILQEPKLLLLLDHSEYNLYAIDQTLSELKTKKSLEINIICILGSVRHQAKMEHLLSSHHVDTIYHAAAYKHVPLVELNIVAGVLNNVYGTLSLAKAALKTRVQTFVLISTDKAVRPTNVMGASKRLAEICLQSLDDTTTNTLFCMVRFGNVLGSSGSVIPLFQKQIEKRIPITITHPDIIRYFMTPKEAAQLVIQAGALCQGGDVFVLDMGNPTKIIDLARKMISLSGLKIKDNHNPIGDIEIQYTGLRPGEKLYEELMLNEQISKTKHPRIMTAREVYLPWTDLKPLLDQLYDDCMKNDCHSIINILQSAPLAYKPTANSNLDTTYEEKWKHQTKEDNHLVKNRPYP